MFGNAQTITLLNVHRPIPSARAAQVKAAEIFRLGEPSHEIATAANDGFHMLVMGTQGCSGLGNLFRGSAAARALVESNIPVRLVK